MMILEENLLLSKFKNAWGFGGLPPKINNIPDLIE